MASSHPLVERFRTGEVPEPLKAAAARGALPLPAEDLVEILFHLRREPSKELQRDIVRTLEGLPLDAITQVAASADTPPAMLDFLARASIRREPVLEQILQNPATSEATLVLLAQHGTDSVLEFLSFNQVRLSRSPAIMHAMLANARLSTSVRRRLQEIAELDAKEAGAASRRPATPKDAPPGQAATTPPLVAAEPAAAAQAPAASAPVLPPAEAVAADLPGGEPAAEPLESLEDLADLATAGLDAKILEEMAADDATEEELRLAQRLLTMSVPEKVQLAMKGDREARAVLIRDSNKQVQEAVINSPKITENEIERIAKMRSVSEDVIRLLTNKREIMKVYTVVSNLVRNPKCPQHIAMQLMQQLQNRDLTQICKDKNIPDAVRRHALITLDKRKPKSAAKK